MTAMHEIVARVARLQLPSCSAFVMPRLQAVRGADGGIVDVAVDHPLDLERQMLEYSALADGGPDVLEPSAAAR